MSTPVTNIPSLCTALQSVPLGAIIPAAQTFISPPIAGNFPLSAMAPLKAILDSQKYVLTYHSETDSFMLMQGAGKRWETRRLFNGSLKDVISDRFLELSDASELKGALAGEGLNAEEINIPDLITAGLLTQSAGNEFLHALGAESWWAKFINPGPRKERSGSRVVRELERSLEMLTSAFLSGAIETVGNTAVTLARLPGVVVKAYKTTWNTPKIGPNMKGLTSVMIPPAAVLTPPLILLGSAVWGIGGGAWRAVDYGVKGAVRKAFGDVTAIDEKSTIGVDTVSDQLMKPLEDGEQPFDIKLLGLGAGLAGAVVSPVVSVPVITAMSFPRSVQIYLQLMNRIWNDDDEHGIVLKSTYSALLTVAMPLAVALVPVAGTLAELGEGAAQGYKNGVTGAVGHSIQRIRDFWSATGKLARDEE